MSQSTSWHSTDADLAAYTAGTIDFARAHSLEAHLLGCAACRVRLAAPEPGGRLDAVWAEIVDTLDAPAPGPIERLLGGAGVADHTGRLLAATPSLQGSWLVAVALTLAFAAVAAQGGGDRGLAVFLVMAPLVPLAGVAAAFGPGLDPTAELTASTPLAGFRLLLLRAVAVFTTTIALAGLASLALPVVATTAAAWVLPALGLTLGTLALATVLRPEVAAGVVASGWVITVATSFYAEREWLAAFGATGQLACLAISAVSLGVLAVRSSAFDPGAPGSRRTPGSQRAS